MTSYKEIGEFVVPIKTWNPSRSEQPKTFTYIDLSSVDQFEKRIANSTEVSTENAPSRARQLIATGDILVSTVRPNLNAVAQVPAELDGATASTGFCVLRPKPPMDGAYLFHWLRSPSFVADMTRKATGQSYPAVSDRIIKESLIPLPPFEEQQRIAEVLDRVDALRAKRRRAIANLDVLVEAIFLDMFGRPSEDWPSVTVEDVAAPLKNSIRTGPFGSQLLHEEFVDEGIAVLGIDNAVANEFRWGAKRYITEQKYKELIRYTVQPGDVLITIMGTCGRCAIVPDDIPTAINTKHLCCITLDQTKCLPEFLHSSFLHHPEARKYLQRTAKGAIMAGLNMSIIKALPMRLPPIEQQRRFAQRLASVNMLKLQHSASLKELDTLFASVQRDAFREDLWNH